MARDSVTHYIEDEDTDWMRYAACKKAGKNTMFPVQDDIQRMMANKFCNGCPVSRECLEYALVNVIDYGVWGGKTEKERRIILRRGGRRFLKHATDNV